MRRQESIGHMHPRWQAHWGLSGKPSRLWRRGIGNGAREDKRHSSVSGPYMARRYSAIREKVAGAGMPAPYAVDPLTFFHDPSSLTLGAASACARDMS
jgi:hypothetical protein